MGGDTRVTERRRVNKKRVMAQGQLTVVTQAAAPLTRRSYIFLEIHGVFEDASRGCSGGLRPFSLFIKGKKDGY
jgi:hypothetical protein